MIINMCLVPHADQILLFQPCKGQQATFGKRPPTYANAPSSSSVYGLFLNPNYSSSCNGTVTAWRFCYFLPSEGLDTNNLINVSVWRPHRVENNRTEYEKVTGSNGPIVIQPRDGTYSTEFVCQTWNLTNNSFSVMEGDIVGAYFSDNVTVHILGSVDGISVLHGDSVNETVSNLDSVENYGLYLEAVLGKLLIAVCINHKSCYDTTYIINLCTLRF